MGVLSGSQYGVGYQVNDGLRHLMVLIILLGSLIVNGVMADSIVLCPGLNLIGISVDKNTTPDTFSLIEQLGTPDIIDKLQRFNPTHQIFENTQFNSAGDVTGSNTLLQQGEGWLVFAKTVATLTVTPSADACGVVELRQGLNVLGMSCSPLSRSAFELLPTLGGSTVVASVQSYDLLSGRFLTAGYDLNGNAVGANFVIEQHHAYLVHMRQAATLTIYQNPTELLADAGPFQEAIINTTIILNGSYSSNAATSFNWTMVNAPDGSGTDIQLPTGVTASIIPDLPGIYTLRLEVSDGIAVATDETEVTAIDASVGEDTDQDGLSDAAENILGTDVDQPDSDFDGLSDSDEVFIHQTNPLNRDSDNDGYNDGNEIAAASNPFDNTSTPLQNITTIAQISPQDGESMVSIKRETIVQFSRPIDASSLTAEAFYLLANGQQISGSTVLSRAENQITFFYDTPLPGSTAIRVVINGELLLDQNGRKVDANGNDYPGGVGLFDFTTLSLTQIPGTRVSGYIFDANRVDEQGNNIPIADVVIDVDGMADIQAVTDENGFFVLEDTPAPEFFVTIDASNSPAPSGARYGKVRKPMQSVAGHSMTLAVDGKAFDIFLPLMYESDITPIVADQTTAAKFGPEALNTLTQIRPDIAPSMWEKLQVLIPPNAIFHDDGTPASVVTVIPLPAERIPGPIPEGLDPAIVFTVEAGGASNVDGYAQLVYPNVDNLPPGETRFLWSFDHDAGKWITTGTMTVSDDGAVLVSDPDAGVKTLGWRFIGLIPWTKMVLGCSLKAVAAVAKGVGGCAKGVAKQVADLINEVDSGLQKMADLTTFNNDVNNSITQQSNGSIIVDKIDKVLQTKNDIQSTLSAFTTVWGVAQAVAKNNPVVKSVCAGIGCAGGIVGGLQDICQAQINGTQCFTDATSGFCQGVETTSTVIGKANDFKKIIGLTGSTTERMCAVVDELNQLAKSWMGSSQPFPYSPASTLVDDIRSEITIVDQLTNNTRDFMQSFLELDAQASAMDRLTQDLLSKHLMPSDAFYAIFFADLDNFVIRGFTSASGELSALVPANTPFVLIIFEPAQARIAIAVGVTSGAGQLTLIPLLTFDLTDDMVDTDLDGLADEAERVIGTDPSNPDTDGDGLTDAAEIEQGLDPLDDRGFPTGIIGQLPLQGEPQEIVIIGSAQSPENQTAYIATGTHGLAIVDVSQFSQPILLGQLDLAGNARDIAVDQSIHLAFLPTGNHQISVVNVTDPQMLTLHQTIYTPDDINAVEVMGGFLFAGGNLLSQYGVLTGQKFKTIDLGSRIVDLAKAGTQLYAITEDKQLHIIETAPPMMKLVGSLVLPIEVHRIFVGNDIVYVANGIENTNISIPNPSHRGGYVTIDVADPTNPVLISGIDTPTVQAGNLKTVTNGSGLALVAGGFRGLQIHRATDSATTYDLLTEISLPGRAISVAIAGGIAFVIDDSGKLSVVNYLSFDSQGNPPAITIQTSATTASVEEGSILNVSAQVSDDVQVRRVVFFMDDKRIGTDLSFPFEQDIVVPRLMDQSSMTLVARAIDTGGNVSDSIPLVFTIIVDATAPQVIRTTPFAGGFRANVNTLGIYFTEPMDAITLSFASLTLSHAGADELFDTEDDTSIPINVVNYETNSQAAFTTFSQPLAIGQYRASLADSATDLAGNPLTQSYQWSFTVFEIQNDTDGDCVPDEIEVILGLDPNKVDSDGDTIPDGDIDSDGDGLINCEEVLSGLKPQTADSDGDLLFDGEELFFGTNPLSPDSDNDGYSDKDELDFNSDPLNILLLPTAANLPFNTASGSPLSVVNTRFVFLDSTELHINSAQGGHFSVLNTTIPSIVDFSNQAGESMSIGSQFSVLNTTVPLIESVITNTSGEAMTTGAYFSIKNQISPLIEPYGTTENGVAGGPVFSIINGQ